MLKTHQQLDLTHVSFVFFNFRNFNAHNSAKRNQICAAIFPEDGLWYRGKIEKISREGMATITFIDYGNRALVEKTQLAELPAAVSCDVLEGQAKEFQLALVKPPADEVKILKTIKVYFINYFQTILFRLF